VLRLQAGKDHMSVQETETTTPMERCCVLEDIWYGAKIYVYMPVNEKGEPQTVELDVYDAREAVGSAEEEYWYCRCCGDEWHDWDEVKKHLEASK
jgi:hypothetical protein